MINLARSIGEVLQAVTDKAREIVGAHQAVTSVVIDSQWARAINAVSLSDKYATWRTYDEQPDGSGIYRLVCQMNRPLRMKQAELEAHPAWRGFGKATGKHPPMRGWLAVPPLGGMTGTSASSNCRTSTRAISRKRTRPSSFDWHRWRQLRSKTCARDPERHAV